MFANWQNFSRVQSKQQPYPYTITAALTVAPTSSPVFLAGTTAVQQITPPDGAGVHVIEIIHSTTNFGGFTTAGNIIAASITNSTSWQNKVSRFLYNPVDGKYYPTYGTLT